VNPLRLDSFLRNIRVYRRSVAKKATLSGRILVNGESVKASREIREGDTITILDADENQIRRIRILREATRPVPKKKEKDYYEDV